VIFRGTTTNNHTGVPFRWRRGQIGGRDPSREPKIGWDGEDWHDVRRQRGKALGQDGSGRDGQQGFKRQQERNDYGNGQSRFTVTEDSHDDYWRKDKARAVVHSQSRPPRRHGSRSRSAAGYHNEQRRDDDYVGRRENRDTEFEGREDQPGHSQYKRFVTFYFTNFSAQISNFYLRKGFEVCGMLEEVVVPSKQNVNREIFGFVRYSKVKDFGKLLKAVNVVCFVHFRVRAKVARFDRSYVSKEKEERVGVGVRDS